MNRHLLWGSWGVNCIVFACLLYAYESDTSTDDSFTYGMLLTVSGIIMVFPILRGFFMLIIRVLEAPFASPPELPPPVSVTPPHRYMVDLEYGNSMSQKTNLAPRAPQSDAPEGYVQ